MDDKMNAAEVITLTRTVIHSFRRRVQDILKKDFPSDVPRCVGKLYLGIADLLEEALDHLSKEHTSNHKECNSPSHCRNRELRILSILLGERCLSKSRMREIREVNWSKH